MSLNDSIEVQSHVHHEGNPKGCLSTLNPDNYALAISGGNESLAPILWSAWESFYQPKAIAGDCYQGKIGPASWVLRVPDNWNGRLVSCAAPATRNQFSLDLLWSDFLLQQGYAFLCSDKGTPGFVVDGDPLAQLKNALLEDGSIKLWHQTYRNLTQWAQGFLKTQFSERCENTRPITYAVGVSNGGYVVRYALENEDSENPLFDGGLDWEGVCWHWGQPDLISTMLLAVKSVTGLYSDDPELRRQANENLISAGMPEAPESLMKFYEQWYWFPVLNIYRDYFDRSASERIPWQEYVRFDESGMRITKFDKVFHSYQWPPTDKTIEESVVNIQNTGKINVPLISLFGTMDCLTFPSVHGVGYQSLVKANQRDKLHRLYWVDKGTHVDGLVGSPVDPKEELKPILPYAHGCFMRLVSWVEDGMSPPVEQTF